LSAKTTTAQIDALGILTPEEMAHHASVQATLKEGNAKEKAARLNTLAKRITALADAVDERRTWVNSTVYSKLKALAENYYSARSAASVAAQQFKEDEQLLPGTGGEAWRALFEAARQFVLESHPNHTFPHLEPDSPCPLCQGPLNQGAERLKKFEVFVTQEAEKNMQACRTTLGDEYSALMRRSLELGLDDLTYGEIEALDKPLAEGCRAFEGEVTGRRDLIKKAVADQTWPGGRGIVPKHRGMKLSASTL
jgi:hypothetical protein